jgi:hypothetical protein
MMRKKRKKVGGSYLKDIFLKMKEVMRKRSK